MRDLPSAATTMRPRDSCLAILLNGERQLVVVNLLVSPHIGLWITGDGIVLSVKLTGPLIMRRLTVLVGAIDDNFTWSPAAS